MISLASAPESYEVVVDLGTQTFAEGYQWRFAAMLALGVLFLICAARVPKATGGGERLSYLLGAVVTAGLCLPVSKSITEIDGPRQRVQVSAITERSGYTFVAGSTLLDSGEPFQDQPVIVERGDEVRQCVLSSWRLHRKTGEWQADLSAQWRDNTRTQKIRLTCIDEAASR